MNMGNQENSIYIIDKNHRVLYFNERIKTLFPELQCGDLCYEAMCRRQVPCASCPLAKREGNSSMFYNTLLGTWTEVSAAAMDWPGAGACSAMFIREIHTQNMNLFYGLTSSRAYDELFELNLTKDEYKILFHVENKYLIPAEQGRLHSMARDVADYMIHPDDRGAFLKFWDLESLVQRLTAQASDNVLRAQFRKRMVDGGYCWVSQIAVLVSNSEHDGQIVMCFIQDINEQKLREQELQNQGSRDVDSLTGLYRRHSFFSNAEAFLENADPGKYCLVAIDIEHFKLFNEWYGQKAGDCFLIRVGDCLKQVQAEYGGVAGYMGSDDFGIVLPNDRAVLDRLQNQIVEYAKEHGKDAGFMPAFGIYPIDNPRIPASGMYDRAVIALGMIKGNYAVRSSWYDSEMKQKMEENHKLLSDVQRALTNHEFTFYAQPKCNMATGKIIGLESLVRWNHPEKGIVPPGSFIPLLEENGFISNLDLYIWEEVCRSVRGWMDRGYRAVPISVNVSRVDIYTLDVVKTFKDLTDKYSLPPALIEAEITESAYAEDYTRITAVAEGLRNAGFTVLMDDFGSGFSSLNMLKDVKVDVLKIDMKFLEMDEQSSNKGMNILETVINMARLMGLRVIAEGVETREQADFLLDMGCNYAQGYYFYRPMPIQVFEPLLSNEDNIDFRGIQAKQVGRLHVKELLGEDAISQTLLNNILGAVAFYDVCGDRVELVRVNEQYYRVTRTNPVDLEERRRRIMEDIYQEDREQVMNIFRQAGRDLQNGAQGDFRRVLGDGSSRWIHIRAFFLREQDGHSLYYGSISDVTEQKRREQQLESSQKALSAVMHISDNDESFMKLGEQNRRAATAIFNQMTPGGMIGAYCESGFPLYFANQEMVRLLGYGTFDEFAEAIHWKVSNTVHPDDRDKAAKDVGVEYYPGMEYTTTYRMPKKDGTWFWTLNKGRVIEAEDGRLAIVGACTDISETMETQRQLAQSNAILRHQNQELNFVNNDAPGGYYRCRVEDGFEFLYISNRFQEIVGYTKDEIRELYDSCFLNMIHPDDQYKLKEGAALRRRVLNLQYRLASKNGWIWVINQSSFMRYEKAEIIQGVVLDVTSMKEKEHQLLMAGKKLESILRLADINCWDWDMERRTLTLYNVTGSGELAEVYAAMQNNEHIISNFPEGCKLLTYIREDYRELFSDYMERIRTGESHKCSSCEIPLTGGDGREIWVRTAGETIYGADKTPVKAVGYYIDITSQKQEQLQRRVDLKTLELLRSQSEFDLRINLTEDIIVSEQSRDGWMDGPGCRGSIYSAAVEGLNQSRVQPEFRRVFREFSDRRRLLDLFRQGIYTDSLDYQRQCGDQTRWTRMVVYLNQEEERQEVFSYMFVMDIDQQKRQEQELARQAETDPLTGLYNRKAAEQKIREYLAGEEPAALIMFDLDNFKAANDVFGHTYGDQMIVENAKKLKSYFREEDIVCRLGGDEFLVLCKNIPEEAVRRKLEQVVWQATEAHKRSGRLIRFSISAGFAMAPEQGTAFEDLYQKADVALFSAKMSGKGTFEKYDPSMKAVRFELAEQEDEK